LSIDIRGGNIRQIFAKNNSILVYSLIRESLEISYLFHWAKSPLGIATLLAVAVRIAVFIGSMVWPIPNESLVPVSPLNIQAYLDFKFYLQSLEQYKSLSIVELFDQFIAFYQRPFVEHFGHIIAGPIFPGLVGIFDYKPGNTLPLAILYLVLSCLLSFVWLEYLNRFKVRNIWLLALALAPNPIWFTLIISPDIVFSALIGFFYYFYFTKDRNFLKNTAWIVFLLLVLLTRPNGYSILLFVFIDYGYRAIKGDKSSLPGVAVFAVLVALFALYLYPYFITEARKAVADVIFYGVTTTEYHNGLFSSFPGIIDKFFSWLLLAGAKIMYFVGLRPSYGDTSGLLVFLRAIAGIILLPGLLYALLKAPRREQLFLVIFFLPIFFGPTQDRYNLPVFAILFGYGAVAWERVFSVLQNKPGQAKLKNT
jgi:hypothetical protein